SAPPDPAYDRVAIALHWSVAVLIVSVGAVGLMFGNLLHGAKSFWLNLHAIAGLGLFALVLLRTFWRLSHRPPVLPPSTGKAAATAAKTLHGLMYGLMLAIPAVGLVSFLWHARVFDFGLFTLDPGITADKGIYKPTQTLHAWMTYGLMAALALHIAASLWHHYALRDGLLGRMLPRWAGTRP
ncbi:MAG: cytochrome b, partial [Rhodospirillaceae bacterium]